MDLEASPGEGVPVPGPYDCRPRDASRSWLAADGLAPFLRKSGPPGILFSLTRRLANG